MTFSTIQPIGKNPATTPSSDARIDIPAGMVKMKIVIRLVTITRSEEHTSELQSQSNLVCRLLLEKKKKTHIGPLYEPPSRVYAHPARMCTHACSPPPIPLAQRSLVTAANNDATPTATLTAFCLEA